MVPNRWIQVKRVTENLGSQTWTRSARSAQDMAEGQRTYRQRSGFSLSQLESGIQKLQLKRQILPELHQEHIIKFCRKLVEEGIYHLQRKKEGKNPPKLSENISCINQKHNLVKEMAEDQGKELERMSIKGRLCPVRKQNQTKNSRWFRLYPAILPKFLSPSREG